MLVICKQCNKEFEKQISQIKRSPNHFCSKSCAAKFNNVGQSKNKPSTRICKGCGDNFLRSKSHRSVNLCKMCLDLYINRSGYYKSRTLAEYQALPSVKGKHFSWINAHVRSFARSWNKNLTKLPCQKCGYNLHVELCHIKAVCLFDSNSLLGDINSSENLLVLCRNHHWEFDHHLLKYEDIPER